MRVPPVITKVAVPCSCVGNCGVVLVTDMQPFGDDPHVAFVEFFQSYQSHTMRHRLRAAWRVLRGKDPWIHDICLDEIGIAQMRQAFSVPPDPIKGEERSS